MRHEYFDRDLISLPQPTTSFYKELVIVKIPKTTPSKEATPLSKKSLRSTPPSLYTVHRNESANAFELISIVVDIFCDSDVTGLSGPCRKKQVHMFQIK